MEASPRPIGSTTTILDLKDDCLREVLALLDPSDLSAVADVCARFRMYAAQSARSKLRVLELSKDSAVNDYSQLRNFGASIKVLIIVNCSRKSRAKFQKRIIKLVSLYFIGKFTKLLVDGFDITDNIALLMVPVLERVQKLEFTRCQFGKVFSKKLSLWSPELRELEFSFCTLSKKDGIRQRFPKLESIGFRFIYDMKNSDMEEFLHQNPQLEQIAIYQCTMLKTWTKKWKRMFWSVA